MSHRIRFIRQSSAELLPHLAWDLNKAIRYSERLWEKLQQKGYGDRKTQGPNPQKDWYKQLNTTQRPLFDRFWQAYGHKVNKQGAAMRWGQLNPGENLAGHIIKAAEAEHQRAKNDPATVRKHAQGWLAEKRWVDHEAQPNAQRNHARQQRFQELQAEATGLRSMLRSSDNPELKQQLNEIEQQMEALK